MVKKKGWASLQLERMDLEDKVKEEEIIEESKFMDNQKRLMINKYQREYYQRPYVKAKRKAYNEANKSYIKQYNKEYYQRTKKNNIIKKESIVCFEQYKMYY